MRLLKEKKQKTRQPQVQLPAAASSDVAEQKTPAPFGAHQEATFIIYGGLDNFSGASGCQPLFARITMARTLRFLTRYNAPITCAVVVELSSGRTFPLSFYHRDRAFAWYSPLPSDLITLPYIARVGFDCAWRRFVLCIEDYRVCSLLETLLSELPFWRYKALPIPTTQ